ncbi:MAG: hypothetical protein LBE91_08950, partial [Tannerella sp.]|nr:hypothetical protein [Tannerella sp.]
MKQKIIRGALVLLSLLMVNVTFGKAPKPLKIKVKVEAGDFERNNTIASFDISSYAIPAGTQVVVKSSDGKTAPCQVDVCPEKNAATLYFKVEGKMAVKESRVYSIGTAPATATAPAMTVEKDRFGNLILKDKNINVLQYNTLVARLP